MEGGVLILDPFAVAVLADDAKSGGCDAFRAVGAAYFYPRAFGKLRSNDSCIEGFDTLYAV